MEMIKPERLRAGDTVAVVSPSWGGPSVFPHVHENGLKWLRSFGLKVKEFPTARADAGFLAEHPEARAEDINNAFADRDVKAIVATIGGSDSVRILPFLDARVIKSNPKVFMGYSDATTLHTFLNRLGLVSFHGPAVMAGFSQFDSLPEFKSHVKDMLFNSRASYEYKPFSEYSEGYPDWSDASNTGKVNAVRKHGGWKWLQGAGKVEGRLAGGCINVLEFLKGTDFWPKKQFWDKKILLLETSEEKPSPTQVTYWLRNYGMQGVFDKVNAVLFGRARDYSAGEKTALNKAITSVIGGEFSRPDLPVVSNMDFGHTDPQWVLPLGVKAELDVGKKSFGLIEPALN